MAGTYLRLNPVDLTRIFQPGQQLEITLNRTIKDDQNSAQISVVARVISLDNNQITLALLEYAQPQFNLFRPGRVVTIQTGRSDGIFSFKSKITNRIDEDGLRIVVESPRILASKERRRRPRIPLTIPVTFRILRFREKELSHLIDKIGYGESRDLSHGGITMLTELKLLEGMVLLLELSLEGQSISFIGQVRRVTLYDRSGKSYSIGIKFLEPGFHHQELIAQLMDKSGERLRGDLSF